jgi:hypothetical protein
MYGRLDLTLVGVVTLFEDSSYKEVWRTRRGVRIRSF